jgi:hypothetical protein
MKKSSKPTARSVLTGTHGYLFLHNDTNRNIEQLEGSIQLSREILDTIEATHQMRTHLVTAHLGSYQHCVIPNKETCLQQFLPTQIHFEQRGPRPITQYIQHIAQQPELLFYRPEILTLPSDTPAKHPYFAVYDTHWNHQGALAYLSHFLAECYPELYALFHSIPTISTPHQQRGDLGVKVNMPAEEVQIISPAIRYATTIFENRIANEGCVRVFNNLHCSSPRTAIIIHDSFTNWLIEFLPELFSQCICIHTADMDDEFVKRYQPDYLFQFQIGISWAAYTQLHETRKEASIHFSDFIPQLIM